jgi:nicotinate-nucleotide pyrophosphorylase (carboxylating)
VAKPKLNTTQLDELIDLALAEDVGMGDVTTEALVDPRQRAVSRLVAKEHGVLAGMPVVKRLLKRFDPKLRLSQVLEDGALLKPGTVIGVIRGPLAATLTVERTMLNFLQRLSGIATLTRRYVDAVAGTGAQVLDTRKTLPGWRDLAKYAVAAGGGRNHRRGLHDQVLIKDNHLASGLSPAEAVVQARQAVLARGTVRCRMRVEVEVENIANARAAAKAGADIIMLDNMAPARMKKAVAAIRAIEPQTIIEASGTVTLRRIRAIARTGVDWISIGALTHSAPALDISLDTEPR